MEFEHKPFWMIKQCNMNLEETGAHSKLDLQELEEIRSKTYKNALIYKERSRAFHNQQISRKTFEVGQKVLLYQSKFKLFQVNCIPDGLTFLLLLTSFTMVQYKSRALRQPKSL